MASLTSHEQNQLVTETMDLVGHIVAEVSARYPRHVDRSELWNAGALGLVEASRRFDPDSGIPFARYAAIRIRGAIIDSTRTRDWASRSVRRRLREIQQATAGIEEQHGRAPTSGELADFLDITEDELKPPKEGGEPAIVTIEQFSDKYFELSSKDKSKWAKYLAVKEQLLIKLDNTIYRIVPPKE